MEFERAFDPETRIRTYGTMFVTGFLPASRLERAACYEFASALAKHLELGPITPESNQWSLQGAARYEGLEIVIHRDSVQVSMQDSFQADERRGQEWMEQLCSIVLHQFQERFKPNVCLATQVAVRGLLKMNGDSRDFLAEKLMRINPALIQFMERPLNVLGLRLDFPPQAPDEADSDQQKEPWGVDTKIESFAQDPTQLFLEVQSLWPKPSTWSESTIDGLVLRVKATDDVLKGQVYRLLKAAADGEVPPDFGAA